MRGTLPYERLFHAKYTRFHLPVACQSRASVISPPLAAATDGAVKQAVETDWPHWLMPAYRRDPPRAIAVFWHGLAALTRRWRSDPARKIKRPTSWPSQRRFEIIITALNLDGSRRPQQGGSGTRLEANLIARPQAPSPASLSHNRADRAKAPRKGAYGSEIDRAPGRTKASPSREAPAPWIGHLRRVGNRGALFPASEAASTEGSRVQ